MRGWGPFGTSTLEARSVARSHVGLVRQINEDRVFDCPDRRLWAVADGMGGHSGGDLAAQTVVDALRDLAQAARPIDAMAMVAALHRANSAIAQRNAACGTRAGATVVAAHLGRRTMTLAWAGDSRAYLLRDGAATQLSHDHSLVQELIDAGLLTVEAAVRHPRANVVTRALGVGETVEIAIRTIDLVAGDRVLLCSDGLSRSGEVSSSVQNDLGKMADVLIADALRKDGTDNISLVCLDVG